VVLRVISLKFSATFASRVETTLDHAAMDAIMKVRSITAITVKKNPFISLFFVFI